MLAILSSLNAHSFPIFQPILMILVSKVMVHRALSDKTYLSLGLLSPLTPNGIPNEHTAKVKSNKKRPKKRKVVLSVFPLSIK